MCIICGNLENISLNHINNIISELNDTKLDETIEYFKKHLKNFQKLFPLPAEEIKEIRKILLQLLAERARR